MSGLHYSKCSITIDNYYLKGLSCEAEGLESSASCGSLNYNLPKNTLALIPISYEQVTLHEKSDFLYVGKLKILKWEY